MVWVLCEYHHSLLSSPHLLFRGPEFSALGLSAFEKLRKLTLKGDGLVDAGELRTVLDQNQSILKHLTLCDFTAPNMSSWDLAFESETINNLTHLHLTDIPVSNFMLTRIASAHNLKSLTLPALFVDLDAAATLFASDRIIDGSHTLLPHLEAFRLFSRYSNRGTPGLYPSVLDFLRKRDKLRRLDLGACPWHIMQDLLPELRNLRALFVLIDGLSHEMMKSLVESIPRQMVAIRVFADVCEGSLVRNHSLTSLSTHAPVGSICWLFFSLAHTILPKFPD